MDKKESQIIHAKHRFEERYGNKITDKQLEELASDVKKGYCQEIQKISKTRTIYKSGEWYFCYDWRRKQVCTFLTKEQAENAKLHNNRKPKEKQSWQIHKESINETIAKKLNIKV